jgi:hypothetical protein
MKDKLILHRGYKGKYPENSNVAFENALQKGYSFETDIRVYNNKVYMKHDKVLETDKDLCSLDVLCDMIGNSESNNNSIFLHIKELKDVYETMKILEKYNIKSRIKLFGCDEITLDLIDLVKYKFSEYNVGIHCYEDNNFTEEDFRKADFIWADEISKKNVDSKLINLANKIGNQIYTISPELISQSVFNKNIEKRWEELLKMNVDGICTDKPEEFEKFKIN